VPYQGELYWQVYRDMHSNAPSWVLRNANGVLKRGTSATMRQAAVDLATEITERLIRVVR
jgi:hypothetical protein